MTQHIITNPEGRVLSKIDTGPTFWGDRQQAECLNFKYAVKFPTGKGARAAAAMHGGAVDTIVKS